MQIDQKKTKIMIISYTDKYKFASQSKLKGQIVEIVDKMNILGVTKYKHARLEQKHINTCTKSKQEDVTHKSSRGFGLTIPEKIN